MTADLRIELLGHFRITQAGDPVSGIHARQQELLAYLILNRHRPHSRQQIAGLFWPESTDTQALTNLRRELHNLRRTLPRADQFISVESDTVRWRDAPSFGCDVCDFEAAVAHGGPEGLEEAARLPGGSAARLRARPEAARLAGGRR